MRLLIDADILVYRAGFAVRDEPVAHALRATKLMLNSILKRCRYDEYSLYLSADNKSNFRYEVAITKPYKGNRTQPRPLHYNAIRTYLIEVHGAEIVEGMEADDKLGIEQYKHFQEDENSSAIVTIDKDLNMIPGWHFNFVKNLKYFITPLQATRAFYTQLLTGDSTDNIPGLPNIGPVKAAKIIAPCRTEEDMMYAVSKAYDEHIGEGWEEYMKEQRELVWIKREEE